MKGRTTEPHSFTTNTRERKNPLEQRTLSILRISRRSLSVSLLSHHFLQPLTSSFEAGTIQFRSIVCFNPDLSDLGFLYSKIGLTDRKTSGQ
ncbi:hypothetical protein TNIN_416891 [Trichonephila inaurata madagascariensis]|uniref:Uncharacterized protein n=1 Tax=Trichonephila inaurata madagascariensis TaxID=2747483 RepID=A0A8X6IM34_9ARAC|nr:hypothetical protein TNIN_416891 [Trichonephila inaurata madagascariensis]